MIEVRILHDGTNGVGVNKFILVRDGGWSPLAQDVKTCMRYQAARNTPHVGLAGDVEGRTGLL